MKRGIRILSIMLCGIILTGCGMEKLSDKYNEDEVRSATEDIITLLNEGKYDEIVKNGAEGLDGDGVTYDLKTSHESIIKDSGAFDTNKKMVFQEKSGYAVVVTLAKYEKKTIKYTFTFDENVKIIQLFMK